MQIDDCKLQMGETKRIGPALPAADLFWWTAVGGAGFLLSAGCLLVVRRAAGALAQPLSLPALLLVAVVLVAAAVAVRLGRRISVERAAPRRADSIAVAVSAAVLLVGVSLSLPGTSSSGLALFWLILAAEEVWAWRAYWQPGERGVAAESEAAAAPAPSEPSAYELADAESGGVEVDREESPLAAAEDWDESFAEDEPPGDEVIQQLTRSRMPDGSETLAGWLRVGLAAGQRNTNVHVAFCPPFDRTPQVSIEQLDGPETRIKIVQVLPYGVRCDLKLAGASEAPSTILLQLSVDAEPAPRGVSSSSGGLPAGDSA